MPVSGPGVVKKGFKLGFYDPYLGSLGDRPVSGGAHYERTSMETGEGRMLYANGGSIELGTQVSEHVTVSIAPQVFFIEERRQRGQTLDPNEPVSPEEEYRSYTKLGLTPRVTYDSRNSFLLPTSGDYVSVAPEFGMYGGDQGYVRLGANARHYQPVGWGTMVFGVSGGVGRNLSDWDKFYLGGPRGVRNLSNPSAAADIMTVGTLEYRTEVWDMGGGFKTQAFIGADVGTNFTRRGYVGWWTGLGVILNVPYIGPIKIYWGLPLWESMGFGFSFGTEDY
jgi:outer membrane protein assembly factor BamA